jgi:hypothetical protein
VDVRQQRNQSRPDVVPGGSAATWLGRSTAEPQLLISPMRKERSVGHSYYYLMRCETQKTRQGQQCGVVSSSSLTVVMVCVRRCQGRDATRNPLRLLFSRKQKSIIPRAGCGCGWRWRAAIYVMSGWTSRRCIVLRVVDICAYISDSES